MLSDFKNRRELIKGGARIAAGVSLSSSFLSRNVAAQLPMPVPQPIADKSFTFVSTTEADPWQSGSVFQQTFAWDMLNLNIDPDKLIEGAPSMKGFGACFNELGWTSLSVLSEQDRERVFRELFDPRVGARFSYCRMPIGANDFATEAYSYDETDGDFDLKHFSIDHDTRTLIPFIRAAKKYNSNLKLWASPWTPPSWMKRNHFYAEAPGVPAYGFKENGIRQDQIGHEGQDMFIQEPRYLETYARYFGRFIDAYKDKGIRIDMVMPQNEFNSAQNFPSCTWTAEGLARFLHYLGPEMQKRDVEIFFGTLERGDVQLLKTVMADQDAAKYVKGVGVQWAGKNALPAISKEFPAMTVFQSEQECGDGQNSWSYTSYCWQLMKHYFRSGASGYMYWNISTDQTGKSSWGWAQNSLVSVDTTTKTFHYNHDYYLMKHLSHFVEPGARSLEASGSFDDALAFLNPDGAVVMLLRNELSRPHLVQVKISKRIVAVNLPSDSIATLTVRPA